VSDVPSGAARVVIVGGGFAGLAWDFLVLAAGAHHSWFGHDEWARFAPGLKTI
jgi:NADH dehydrogenase